MSRLSVTAACLVAVACRNEPPPRVTPSEPGPPPPSPRASAEHDAGAQAPGPTASSVPRLPAKMSIERVVLSRTKDAAFERKTLPKARKLGTGGLLKPGLTNPDRIVIESLAHDGALLDAENAQAIARFPKPRGVSPEAGVVVIDSNEPELFRLSDLTRVKPELDPPGELAKSRFVAASPRHRQVVLLSEQRDGSARIGVSTDDRYQKLRAVDLPFVSDSSADRALVPSDDASWHVKASARIEGGTPHFLPHGSECLRAQVDTRGNVSCIEYSPARLPSGPRWLTGGWVASDDFFSHVSWREKTALFVGVVGQDPCHVPLTWADPPRAYVQCMQGHALFAPDAVLSLDELSPPRISGLLGADAGPIVPLISTDDSDGPARIWLDLRGKRALSSEPLRPLAVAAFAGVPEIALAARPESKEVWVLDFARASMTLAAEIDDCPGELRELRELEKPKRPRYLILACLTRPPPHSVTQHHIWSEVVDLTRRVRYRSSRLPEIVFDDGLVVLSTRTRLSAESRDAPGELSSVRL
ncbi:MAG: hypothetical protein U0263_00830 [Polyangiaceae bacterium]